MADVDLIMSRADSAVVSRDYVLAERLYKSLLKESPHDLKLLSKIGSLYIKSGNDKKALPFFQQIYSLDSTDISAMLALGGIYRRLQKYNESVEILTQALKKDKDKLQTYYNLGFTYKQMGKNEEAVDCFETVVTLNPNDVLAYNHLGTIYASEKNHAAAIQAYLMGLKIDQNHPILHLNLAKSYDASGNTVFALREYEAALRSKPGWAEAVSDYTKLLMRLNKTKEASELTKAVLRVNPDDTVSHTNMGDIFMAQSDYDRAAEEYQKAVSLDGRNADALAGLAEACNSLGKTDEALDYMHQSEKLHDGDEEFAKKAIDINISANKFEEASKQIEEALQAQKNNPEYLDLAGQYYICTENDSRAEDCYDQIEKITPTYKKHLSNASKRYRQIGKLAKANEYIKKYLSSCPTDSKALVLLGMIEEAMGNIEQALGVYNRALGFDPSNVQAKNAVKRILDAYAATREKLENEDLFDDADVSEIDSNVGSEFDSEISSDLGPETSSEGDYLSDSVSEKKSGETTPEENNANDISDDDFDFEAFGKTPLVEENDDSDIFAYNPDAEENTVPKLERDLLEDEENLFGDDDGLAEAPQIAVEAEKDAGDFASGLPDGNIAPQSPSLNAPYDSPFNAPGNAPQSIPQAAAQMPAPDHSELLKQMEQIKSDAERAISAADKAWRAAEEAADNVAFETKKKAREEASLVADEVARRVAKETAERVARQNEQERAAREPAWTTPPMEPVREKEPAPIPDPAPMPESVAIPEPAAVEDSALIEKPAPIPEPAPIEEPVAIDDALSISEPEPIADASPMPEPAEIEEPDPFADLDLIGDAAPVPESEPEDGLDMSLDIESDSESDIEPENALDIEPVSDIESLPDIGQADDVEEPALIPESAAIEEPVAIEEPAPMPEPAPIEDPVAIDDAPVSIEDASSVADISPVEEPEPFAEMDNLFDEVPAPVSDSDAASEDSADSLFDSLVNEANNSEPLDPPVQIESDEQSYGALPIDANDPFGNLYEQNLDSEASTETFDDTSFIENPPVESEPFADAENLFDENAPAEEDYSGNPELGLFKKLRSLCEFLPEAKRNQFLKSRARISIDYIIARLENKPGLLETASPLSDQDFDAVTVCGTEPSVQEIKDILSEMKELANGLSDKALSTALCNAADDVEKKL